VSVVNPQDVHVSPAVTRRAREHLIIVFSVVLGVLSAAPATSASSNLLSSDQQGFEASADGWVPQGNTNISRSTAIASTGHASMRVVVDPSGPWPDDTRTARVGTSPGMSGGIAVTPGQTLVGAARVRADSTLSPVRCEIRWYGSDDTTVATALGELVSEVSGQWVRPQCSAQVPAEASYAGLRIFIARASYGDVHYVDDASLSTASAAGTTTTEAPVTSTTPSTTTPPVRGTSGTAIPTMPATVPTTQVPAGAYPAPGSVGFRGRISALHVIDGAAAAPAGTSWNAQYQYLQVDADDLVLDGVYVKGGVDFHGRGTLTIRNSIIEGGWGSWFVVLGRTSGSTMDVRDSTLRWRAGSAPGVGDGAGALQISAEIRIIALRNDISGTADGIQVAGNDTRIEQNWIHDLALVGTYPNNTHNDGIQVYDGAGIVIANNRIEIGFDGQHQNAAVFFQPGTDNAVTSPQVIGNYLQGGGFSLRLEGATTGAVVRDNVFGPLEGGWGHAYARNGAGLSQWSNNRTTAGTVIAAP
jgi:cell division septation protein DedD